MTKRFFNLIPSADSCCILLYGYIGEYDTITSADITRELLEAEASYKKIDVRINSLGGEVYAGIAIFNALRNSKADITIYIDGVAASTASFIASCGKPLKMSRYARLMLHSISGGVYGTTSDLLSCIEEIKQLENTLCEIYSSRCGKSVNEIRATYFDGKDHWLTAQQALELGFIDEIYDTDPVPEDSNPQQIYNIYQNRLTNQKPNNNKMIEQLKKRPSFANCASEADVLQRIGELEANAAKVPALTQERDDLKAKNKVFEGKVAADAEAEVVALVDNAFNEGRISEPQKATYVALLKADRENGEAALKALPAQKRIVDVLGQDGTGPGAWEKRMTELHNKNKK